jgi:hypothetical protein
MGDQIVDITAKLGEKRDGLGDAAGKTLVESASCSSDKNEKGHRRKSLLEMELDAERSAKRSRARAATSQEIELQVARCIYDNFRSWPAHMVDGTCYQGKTLRHRLFEDKQKAAEALGSVTFGSKYFSRLRAAYSGNRSCENLVVDRSQPVDGRLEKALLALRSAACNKSPLAEWLATSQSSNHREWVGLTKAFLDVKPDRSPATKNNLNVGGFPFSCYLLLEFAGQ